MTRSLLARWTAWLAAGLLAWSAAAAIAEREERLFRLARAAALDPAAIEATGVEWGVVPRASDGRRLGEGVALMPSRPSAPIVASIYVLGSALFTPAEVTGWLAAVHAVAPERVLVVLCDLPLGRVLAADAARLGARLVETWGVAYSPWPRDPLTFARSADGRLAVLVRPNLQRGREADAHLGRALVAGLPDDLDAAWGGVYWRPAATPFHNGQVLLTDETAWISIHSLEPRALALAGEPRVPVDGFAGEAGARYLRAVRRAAGELAELYGLPVRFVHPLPGDETPGEARAGSLLRLGGGAGFDLDSLLTLLPPPSGASGRRVALVADPGAAASLVAEATDAELERFGRELALAPSPAALRAALQAASRSPVASRLGEFLDAVAGELAAGSEVVRLPLLWVPRTLEVEPRGGDPGFLVGWHNVVLEGRPEGARAEGFSGLLPGGDALARRAFAAAGYRLDLLPPLLASVVRNGGYRCASQHVRADRGPAEAGR